MQIPFNYLSALKGSKLKAVYWSNENFWIDIITDRIRSMGEGNVFTGVCHSVLGCTPPLIAPPPVDAPPLQ